MQEIITIFIELFFLLNLIIYFNVNNNVHLTDLVAQRMVVHGGETVVYRGDAVL